MENVPYDKAAQKRLCEKIKQARHDAKLSTRRVASYTGFTHGAINNWENGKRPMNMDYVKALEQLCLIKEGTLTEPFADIEYLAVDRLPNFLYSALIHLNRFPLKEQKAACQLLVSHLAFPQCEDEPEEAHP